MLPLDENTQAFPCKVCYLCGVEKPVDCFPKHSMYKDRLDSRCRVCVKKQSAIRATLHKYAPSKPKLCECCNKVPLKWCLDHDHASDKMRGWICDRCNTGLGKLGDSIEGVMNALRYLQKFNEKSNEPPTL